MVCDGPPPDAFLALSPDCEFELSAGTFAGGCAVWLCWGAVEVGACARTLDAKHQTEITPTPTAPKPDLNNRPPRPNSRHPPLPLYCSKYDAKFHRILFRLEPWRILKRALNMEKPVVGPLPRPMACLRRSR